MELASQSVTDMFFAKGITLELENVSPAETALDQDLTAQVIGLGEGKIDLYVPSEAIIEPISPAEDMPEESVLAVPTYEATEDEITSHPVESNQYPDQGMPNDIMAISSSVPDLNPSEASEGSAETPSCEESLGDVTSSPTAPGETGISKVGASVRKFIPPKKDRMDPLKLDMSKPTVMPLTCKFFLTSLLIFMYLRR